MPIRHILNKFLKELRGFFHNLPRKCLSHSSWSFSKNAQQFDLNLPTGFSLIIPWVLYKIGLNYKKIQRKPNRQIEIKLLGIFWKRSWWVAQTFSGQIVKETPEFFQEFVHNVPHGHFDGFFQNIFTVCPLIKLWSKWWAFLKKFQDLPPGYFVGKLFKRSKKDLNLPPGLLLLCPQWFVPSVLKSTATQHDWNIPRESHLSLYVESSSVQTSHERYIIDARPRPKIYTTQRQVSG